MNPVLRCGQINLDCYLASSSYSRIKSKYYIYDKLYTTNLDSFKSLQLESPYGKPSYFKKVELLVEQGLIENVNVTSEDFQRSKNDEILNALDSIHRKYLYLGQILEKKPTEESAEEYVQAGFTVSELKERLYAEVVGNRLQEHIFPVSSITAYNNFLEGPQKADILCLLLERFPIPDDSISLTDIIQYRRDDQNQQNFRKLIAWVNKMTHSKYSFIELQEEIEYLLEEHKTALHIAKIKMKNARLEFAIKVVPETIENFLKINWSKLGDPFFKLRSEKLSLLESERTATGNELAYIINGLR